MRIELSYGAEECLQLMVAVDSAITALSVPALEHAMTGGEVAQSLRLLRKLRSELLRKRADVLSAILAKGKSDA